MQRKWSFSLFFLLTCVVFPSVGWAGGIVQEFKVTADAKVSTSSNAMTSRGKSHNELASKEKPVTAPPVSMPPPMFKVTYDKADNTMILEWKPLTHNGLPAIRYHIYRWTLNYGKAQLLTTVDGGIYRYIDANFDAEATYFYKVIGIFRNSSTDGLYTSFQYPVQQLKPSKGGVSISVSPRQEQQPVQPPQGLGCSLSSDSTSTPTGGLLFLMFLFLLPMFRRPRHLS